MSPAAFGDYEKEASRFQNFLRDTKIASDAMWYRNDDAYSCQRDRAWAAYLCCFAKTLQLLNTKLKIARINLLTDFCANFRANYARAKIIITIITVNASLPPGSDLHGHQWNQSRQWVNGSWVESLWPMTHCPTTSCNNQTHRAR